jgi:MFS family permease
MGTVLGPVVGGGFEIVDWRWGFYINLLLGAILLPTYIFVVPSTDLSGGVSAAKRAKTFDYVGAVLSIGAFVSIIMAINFGGNIYAWDSAQIVALFVVSGALWIAFGVQQNFTLLTSSQKRLFPVHLLKNREIILLFIACAAAGAEAYVTVYYIPIYFQFTRGDSAIMAAVRLLPFIFLLITAIPASGYLMTKWGYYKPWYLAGGIIALVGSVLMCELQRSIASSSVQDANTYRSSSRREHLRSRDLWL